MMFANATLDRPGLYFTIVGEPPLKMLRYQQLYSFFDPTKVNGIIRFVSLSGDLPNGLAAVFDSMVRQIEAATPGFVVVDSFRSVMRASREEEPGALELQDFVQRVALHLTAWEATTFLVGEFAESENQEHPVYTVADSLIALSQKTERNSVVRKLKVVKMRGQSDLPGLHTFRITREGLRVFPRIPKPDEEPEQRDVSQAITPIQERLSTGVSGLDEMLHGGLPRGYSMMVAGPRLGQDGARRPVYRRGGETGGTRRDRDLREASRRLSADHVPRSGPRRDDPRRPGHDRLSPSARSVRR
jgi:circadian clock protein KaiC